MSKSWFTAQAAESGSQRIAKVAVRGYIGELGVSDRDFIDQVESFGEVEAIHVDINSRGGEVDHALGVFNYLRNHAAPVTVRITGVAMSAASIIAMAGNEILMPANTIMMVHQPLMGLFGNAREHRKAADDLEKFESALTETYIARTGKTAEALRELLDAETYMTAAEAVEAGFADRVESLSPATTGSGAKAVAMAMAESMGIPEEVLARVLVQASSQTVVVNALNTEQVADAVGSLSNSPDPFPASPIAAAVDVQAAAVQILLPTATLASRVQIAAAACGLGDYAASFALDETITDDASATAALAAARETLDLCALAGKPDLAPALIRARMPLDRVRAGLVEALAREDANTQADPFRSLDKPAEAQASSVESIWASRRALQRAAA